MTTIKEGSGRPVRICRAAAISDATVECLSCHTANPGAHADIFDHNGFRVCVVVTPEDCAACHSEDKGTAEAPRCRTPGPEKVFNR